MTEQQDLIPLGPGERLRRARKRNKISLRRAARELRVTEAVLESIENGMTGDIPSVYLKGYLRNYARFLGLSAGETRALLESLEGVEPELRSVFPEGKAPRTDRYLKAFSYVLATLLVGTLAWQVTHEAVRLSQGDSPARGATDVATPETAEREGAPYVNASMASLEAMARRSAPAPGGSAGEGAWAALKEPSGEGAEPDAAASVPLPEGFSRIELTASADTWLEITDARGERLEMDLLRGGDARAYQGVEPFTVLVGRAAAVELTVDGERFDLAPFTEGEVARAVVGAAEDEGVAAGGEG